MLDIADGRCRYRGCPQRDELTEVRVLHVQMSLCEGHDRMLEHAVASGYEPVLVVDGDEGRLMEAVTLEATLFVKSTPAAVLIALEMMQERGTHELRAVDLPMWPRRGPVRDEVSCSCGWRGFYDLFPLHPTAARRGPP